MFKFWRFLPIVVLALAFAAIPAASQAQGTSPGMSGQSTEDKMAQGELVRVDTENHTLAIKNAEGNEIEFQYNSETKVVGVSDGVQGLSTRTGTRLMVHYQEQANQKLATKIEIVKSNSTH